jgi:hypothetical protein
MHIPISQATIKLPFNAYNIANTVFQENYQRINEENSPTFDRRVLPLVGAATQESNVWVLSVKGRKKEK